MFTIPNFSDAAFSDQAGVDSRDFDIIAAGISGHGVIQGCAVSASSLMTLAIAAGTVQVDGWKVRKVSAGNVTIGTANATNPRIDLVCVDKTGAKQVIAGTAAAKPVLPVITAGYVVLAAVYVPANDTTIDANQIIDKRCFLPREVVAPAGCVQFNSDFVNGPDANWTSDTSGAGASVAAGTGDQDRAGVLTITTTNVSEGSGVKATGTSFALGSGAVSVQMGIKTSANVSDGTNNYTMRLGINDSGNAIADGSDCVEFRYNHATLGGNWQLVCRSSSTETSADSGIAFAASTRYLLEIEVDAAGGTATFYINGAQVGQISTNVPAGNATGVKAYMSKSAGTSARSFDLDKFAFWFLPSNPY